MNEKRASLEIIAATVDEAIAKGLLDLGLTLDKVDVEVLDEGSRGLLGFGTRHARVRLTIKAHKEEPAKSPVAEEQSAEPAEETPPEPPDIEEVQEPEQEQEVELEPARQLTADDFILSIAEETVSELLEKMRIHARVEAEFVEADDSRNRVPVHVNIFGDDLSILIGRSAETLNALQYITTLIVSKEIGHGVPLVVDVEGYRVRRENQLRQLARQMADQAVKTGRRQVLEPMPPNERRIVHIELRENDQVTTESIGEDPRRKVTIIPKQ